MATDAIDVVVIGAGQAGLAASHELTTLGVQHVVLERAEAVGGAWSHRWDSFCLVTPSHTIRLPGGAYSGPQPHGYLARDDLVAHMQAYARSFAAPVRTGVEVVRLTPADGGGLTLATAAGDTVSARAVVVATGAYQRVHRPDWVDSLPAGLPVVDSTEYRTPASLPDGPVLVVGSGQTGCQLAEELALAGRRVILACGRAPWVPRRIESRDIVDWLLETPFFDQPVSTLPAPAARLNANLQATGGAGGHDLTTRTLGALGVQLAGHLRGVSDGAITFADDLADSVVWGDARYAEVTGLIRQTRASLGEHVPEAPPPSAFDPSGALLSLATSELGCVLLTAGYRPDYRSWIDAPDGFDELGFPVHVEGASTSVDGLYFVGVHFLRTRASSLLMGVGRDARVVAEQVAAPAGLPAGRRGRRATPPGPNPAPGRPAAGPPPA